MNQLDLAVVEARWWRKGNESVRGLFSVLAENICDNPSAYHYEMFNNAASFQETVKRLGRDSSIENIYLAAHGGIDKISGAPSKPEGANDVSRTIIRNTFRSVGSARSKSVTGLYFGCCAVGNYDTMNHIMKRDHGATNHIRWAAGFTEDVDWIESSVFDLLFWNQFYNGGPRGRESNLDRARRTAKYIRQYAKPLADKLGFAVYMRKRKVGGIYNFLADGSDDEYELS